MCFHKYIVLAFVLAGCSPSHSSYNYTKPIENKPLTKAQKTIKDSSVLEKQFVTHGLININALDSTIRAVLHYSTSHNFLNKPIYQNLYDCYLPCEVAIKLCNAQFYLHQNFPNYHLIVFDATRPLHIQKQMWEELDLPVNEKINYLAHPKDISLHNYGAAVDIGIIGDNDVLLDMGTPFDFFGELSEPKKEKLLLNEGKLSKEALNNRLILRRVMQQAGFTPIATEWWHFNSTNKTNAAARYKLIE